MEGAALFVAAIGLADHSGPSTPLRVAGRSLWRVTLHMCLAHYLDASLIAILFFFGSDQQLIKTRPPPWARISCGELYHCSTKKICFSCPSNFECSVVGCIGLFGLRARPLQLLDLSHIFRTQGMTREIFENCHDVHD